jgi:hypothetical protein
MVMVIAQRCDKRDGSFLYGIRLSSSVIRRHRAANLFQGRLIAVNGSAGFVFRWFRSAALSLPGLRATLVWSPRAKSFLHLLS